MIRRAESFSVEGSEGAGRANPSAQVGSQQSMNPSVVNGIAMSMIRRTGKIPAGLLDTLKQGSRGRRQREEQQSKLLKSKWAEGMAGMIKGFMNVVNCEICEEEMKVSNKMLYMCDCEHKQSFCESCLHHYVIYKVKNFEEVTCPRDECQRLLDTSTDFFKQLPADIQKNYRKVHQFFTVANDPNSKLCPREHCEGIIRTITGEEDAMRCDSCGQEFCSKCLLARHAGLCDNKELQFFKDNLHYRQCKRCKFVIEKNQGCNHMTCRCGYQFCYVCGADWKPVHYGDHDENGELIPYRPEPRRNRPAPAANNNNVERECCEDGCEGCCEQCLQGDCCDNCPTLRSILCFPFKLLLCLLLLMLWVIIFANRDLLVMIGLAIGSFIAGMTVFTCEIISEAQGGIIQFLMILLCPITMICGIVVGFKEVFCETAFELLGQTCTMVTEGCSNIWEDD